MRSVVVVFPASMWAMMPMFLQRSNGTVLGTTLLFSGPTSSSFDFAVLQSGDLVIENQTTGFNYKLTRLPNDSIALPSVMRESLISLRHAMYVFFLLDGRAFSIGSVQQFVAQLVDHPSFCTPAGIGQQPADRERCAPVGIDLHRHLIVSAAHAAGLHLKQRLRILHGFREQLQSFVATFFLHFRKGVVKNALGGAALALPHHRVDKLRHQIRTIDGIGWQGPLCCMSFTRHSAFQLLAS